MRIACFCGVTFDTDDHEYASCPSCGISIARLTDDQIAQMQEELRRILEEHSGL